MRKLAVSVTALIAVLGAACVTINVYFPEAAVAEAADRIIEEVRGGDIDDTTSLVQPVRSRERPAFLALASGIGSFLISDAQAQDSVDVDRQSPESRALTNSLNRRFQSLRPYFQSGAVGLTDSGLLDFRDRNLVPLKDRNKVVQLVAAQNNDWSALYREIARLNGHPEWRDNIRKVFAERWIVKAQRGWYYRQGGTWKQK